MPKLETRNEIATRANSTATALLVTVKIAEKKIRIGVRGGTGISVSKLKSPRSGAESQLCVSLVRYRVGSWGTTKSPSNWNLLFQNHRPTVAKVIMATGIQNAQECLASFRAITSSIPSLLIGVIRSGSARSSGTHFECRLSRL